MVGLWALRSDVGSTPEAYADRLSEMADWLGEDHAALRHGHECAVCPGFTSYSRLAARRALWERRSMSETRIRKLAIENYARVLKQAMAARQA